MSEMTEAKLERLAAKAAKKVQNEAVVRGKAIEELEEQGFGTPTVSELPAFDDSLPEDGDEAAAYDIFNHVEEKYPNQAVQYVLRRNGEMIGTVHHPYSWEQIQRKYKGGQYQVTARNVTTKRYIKSETRAVADPIIDEQDSGSNRITMEQVQAQILSATKAAKSDQPPQPSFMEMFAIMNQMNAKQKEAEKEAAAAASSSSTQFMQAFMQMSQNQAATTQAMMLEIAKMTQTMSEKMTLTTQTMFEKMETRFEKILDKISQPKKDEGISTLELLKLSQDSQDKGFKLASQLAAIAEAKAQEKVELMEELEEKFGGKGSGEKKSMTETLIETMLPTISSAMLQAQNAPAQAAAPQPAQRRALPPRAGNPSGNRIPKSQTAIRRTGTGATQTQASNPAAQAQAQGSGSGGGATHGENIEAAAPSVVTERFGLASIPVAETPATAPDPDFDQTDFSTQEQFDQLDQNTIVEILKPVIGASLMNGIEPVQASNTCIEELKAHNISVKNLLAVLTRDDMMNLVATYNLPPEANPWFSEVYANFQNIAGNVAG